jgi:hypothetical protein
MEKEANGKFVPDLRDLSAKATQLCPVPRELEITEEFGTLSGGSLFKIAHIRGAKPKNALIFCHGYRPVGIPLASPYAANDNKHAPVYHKLMKSKDFLVASVSYRREGVFALVSAIVAHR